jgi:hypothetical protein
VLWLTQARRDAGKYVVLFFYPLDFTFVCPVRARTPRVRLAARVAGHNGSNFLDAPNRALPWR